jgi:hypothetical protein
MSASAASVKRAVAKAQAEAEKSKQSYGKAKSKMEQAHKEQMQQMTKDNALLKRKLEEADTREIRLLGDLNIYRFKIKELEETVVRHTNDREDWIDRLIEPKRRLTPYEQPQVKKSVVHFNLWGIDNKGVQATPLMLDKPTGKRLKSSEVETQHSPEVVEAGSLTESVPLVHSEQQTEPLALNDEEVRSFITHNSLILISRESTSVRNSFDYSDYGVSRSYFSHCYPLKRPVFTLEILTCVEDHVEQTQEGIVDIPQLDESAAWLRPSTALTGVISVVTDTPDHQKAEHEENTQPTYSGLSKLVGLQLIEDFIDSKDDQPSVDESKTMLQEKEQLLERLQQEILSKTKLLAELDQQLKYRQIRPEDTPQLNDFKSGFIKGHSEGFQIGAKTGWEQGRVDGLEEASKKGNHQLKRPTRTSKSKEPKNPAKLDRKLTRFKQFILGGRSKAALALKILEKFKGLSETQIKRSARMTAKVIIRQINGFYNTAMQRSKSADWPDELLELVYDEMFQRFGLKTAVEKKLLEFMASAQATSDNPTIGLFCRLSGILQPVYSKLSFKVYIQALAFMLSVKIGFPMSEDIEHQYYPAARATECAKESLREQPVDLAAVQAAIDRMSMPDPRKLNAEGLVELDVSLQVILDCYEDYLARTAQAITSIVQTYRDPPTHLTVHECIQAVTFISPTKLNVFMTGEGPSEALASLAVEDCITLEKITTFCQDKVALTWHDLNCFVRDHRNPSELHAILAAKVSDLPVLSLRLSRLSKDSLLGLLLIEAEITRLNGVVRL